MVASKDLHGTLKRIAAGLVIAIPVPHGFLEDPHQRVDCDLIIRVPFGHARNCGFNSSSGS